MSLKRVIDAEDKGAQSKMRRETLTDDQWSMSDATTSLQKLLSENRDDAKAEFDREFSKICKNKVQLKPWQITSLNDPSSKGLTFLMLASKYSNVKATKFLISRGLNVHKKDCNGLTASDYAWTYKSFKCLIELLKADAPFPKPFNIASMKSSNEKLEIIDIFFQTLQIHKAIESENLQNVESFITQNPNFKCAYNSENQCALTTALKFKKLNIYILLRSKFFEPGIDSDEYFQLLHDLELEDKEFIRGALRTQFPTSSEDHIMKLHFKTRVRSKSIDKQKVFQFYKELDEILEISIILKVIAEADATDVVFDFDQEHVVDMDPTNGKHTRGLTYHSGYILIGASGSDQEVIATIAHEFTHWALQLTYNNKCRPFKKNNQMRKSEFQEIVDDYEKIENVCPIIADVYSCYGPSEHSKELIVRVPQILAFYKDQDELSKCQEDFIELFDFFKEHVRPDFEQNVRMIGHKKQIQQANAKFGLLAKSQHLDFLSSEVPPIDITKKVFIQSPVTKIVLGMIVNALQRDCEFGSKNIFVELKDMLGNLEEMKQIALTEVQPTFFIEDSQEVSVNNVGDELQNFFQSSNNIVLISSNLESSVRNFFESYIEVDFKWNDLNDKIKSETLGMEITFQDSKVTLRNILNSEKLLQETPIQLLLKPSAIKLQSFHENLPSKPRVFIERTFEYASKNAATWYPGIKKLFCSDDLCSKLLVDKTVLIADFAGMGKSTSATQLARDVKHENPLSWVVFIDLKQHTKAFLRDHEKQPENLDLNYFSRKLLKLDSTFEQNLFEHFFDAKKVIFIIDGFDEISPNFKKFVTKILKTIKTSENCLLVTTRPHCSEKLEKELKTEAIRIVPFSKEEQIRFLTKSWEKKSNEYNFAMKVEEFLYQCEAVCVAADFYKAPIHIFMLAEVYENQDLIKIDEISPNIFTLYKQFIRRKLNIWSQKGPLASDESTTIHESDTNLSQIFHRIALEQFFSVKDIAEMNLHEISEEIFDELVARVGIVAYGPEGSVYFMHRTYAEYFLADFIIKGAFKKKPQIPSVRLFAKVIGIESYKMVRKFLNDSLELKDDCETTLLISFIEEFAKKEKYSYSLKFMLEEEKSLCQKLVHFIFALDFDYKIKVKALKETLQEEGYHFERFKAIWNRVETFIDQEIVIRSIRKELLHSEVDGQHILLRALDYEKDFELSDENKVSQLVIDVSTDLLDEIEFVKFYYDEGGNGLILSKVIAYDNGTFEKIWEAAEKKLKTENLRKLVLGKDWSGDTLLHSFGYKNITKILRWLRTLKKNLNGGELNEYLTETNGWGQMFNHVMLLDRSLRIEEIKEFWEFIQINTSAVTQRKLLLDEDKVDKKIFVEVSVNNFEEAVIDYIFDITELMLDQEGKDIIEFLRKRGSLTDIILRIIFFSKNFFDKYSSKLKVDELQKIFSSKTTSGDNVLHCMAKVINSDSLWEQTIEQISDARKVKNLLLEKSSSKRCHVFTLAASKNNRFLIKILEWSKTNFDDESFKKIFIVPKYERSLLHQLARHADENVSQDCLEFFFKNFSTDEQLEMLRQENEEGQIPVEMAFQNRNQDAIETIGKVYRDLFTDEELEEIISKIGFGMDCYDKKTALANLWDIF